MTITRSTLLQRVKDPGDVGAWQEFHQLYAPLLFRYARARGLSRDDAEEVRDQCLEIVARKMESFAYAKTKGGFKAWLSMMVNRKVIDMVRRHRENIAVLFTTTFCTFVFETAPIRPEFREPYPENPVARTQPWKLRLLLQNGQLLAKCEVFGCQFGLVTEN